MSYNYFTPFVDGPSQIMNAALLNSRMGQLDEAIVQAISGATIGVGSATDVIAQRFHTVYVFGDSLTAAPEYAAKLETLLGAGWSVRNQGISGNTTTQMLARLAADVLNAGDGEYIVVLGGINDITADVAAVTIEANLQAIYTAASGAGLTVVACTITPFKTNAAWTADRQIVLDAVNTWILNTATNVNVTVDTYETLEEGATDTLVVAYDSGDHLHLSTAGYELLATTVYNAVTWTADTAPALLQVSGGSIGLNQSLRNTDSPTFHSLTIIDVLNMPVWKPLTDGIAALQIADAAGTAILTIDTTNLCLGLYELPDADTALKLGRRDLGAGDVRGVWFLGGKEDASGTNSAYGLYAQTINYALGASAVNTKAVGVWAQAGNYSATGKTATITNGYAFYASTPLASGAGTNAIGTAYGLYIEDQGGTGITESYGISIASQTGANGYAFLSLDGQHYFGSAAAKIGFFGTNPIVRAVLATGAGATVDNVITALQNLGLVKQA